MKFLSLFSGIGAPEQALKKLGVNFDLVAFSEFDKFATRSYCAIHGVDETKNLGDITKVDEETLPKDLDLITYGFPCQDISACGHQKGLFNDDGTLTRSGLFFDAFYRASYVVSDTQLYKQAGNSIVVDVLIAIFKELSIGVDSITRRKWLDELLGGCL